MSPKKSEISIHGCHCLCDMAVRMREVLASPWFGVCVPLALSLHYYHSNFFAYAIEFISIYFLD